MAISNRSQSGIKTGLVALAMFLYLLNAAVLAHTNVVVIPLGDDAIPPKPFAPVTADGPQDSDYTIPIIFPATVIDEVTGLEWQRGVAPDLNPLLPGYQGRTWQQALDFCSGLSLDGQNDWRVPQVNELQSIVSYSSTLPAVNEVAFPNTAIFGYFWSASSNAIQSSHAWDIKFSGGTFNSRNKTEDKYVRCVRGSAASQGWVLQDNGNGTVSDLATGLMWQQVGNGGTHALAITNCDGLTLGGKSDWRLPAIKELSSIVDYRADNPAIDKTMFPGTNSTLYWSAPSDADDDAYAWVVWFSDGTVGKRKKTFYHQIRCVR